MAPTFPVVKKASMFKVVVMDFEPDVHMSDPGVDGVDDDKKSQLQNIVQKLKEENLCMVICRGTTCCSVAMAL